MINEHLKRMEHIFFLILRIAKGKHLSCSLDVSTYLPKIFSKLKKGRVLEVSRRKRSLGATHRAPFPGEKTENRSREPTEEHSELSRSRGSEITLQWKAAACPGQSRYPRSIGKGVGEGLRDDAQTLCSTAPPSGKERPLQWADQLEDFSTPENGSLEKFPLRLQNFRKAHEWPRRKRGHPWVW